MPCNTAPPTVRKSAISARSVARAGSSYADVKAFFGALLEVKHVEGVHNTAVALRVMAQLAAKQLAIEGEHGDG